MAIQTRILSVSTDSNNETFQVEYDYDDVDLRIRQFRGINNQNIDHTVTAHDIAADRTYTKVCPANQTTTQNVPTGAAQRLQLFVNANGKLDGVEWSIV